MLHRSLRWSNARASVVLVILGLAVPATSASAYTHTWDCSRTAGNHCTDVSGQYFNPWHYEEVDIPYVNGWWCASSLDHGGGSHAFACLDSAFGTQGTRCDLGDVQAYTFGQKYEGSVHQYGHADTNGGC
jgi:hypothetical protein